jgi:hypothetical protein
VTRTIFKAGAGPSLAPFLDLPVVKLEVDFEKRRRREAGSLSGMDPVAYSEVEIIQVGGGAAGGGGGSPLERIGEGK